jgi:hypothetical protein
VGHVSSVSAVLFVFAAFFCGIVLEYNARIVYTDEIQRSVNRFCETRNFFRYFVSPGASGGGI